MPQKICGVIPARLASTRLPGKMLLNQTGKPLLQHVWERVAATELFDELIIATDSTEIFQVAQAFGAHVEMTGEHASGTDRVAEVIRRRADQFEIVVNVQGDEPEIDRGHISKVIESLLAVPKAQMSTLAAPLRRWESIAATSCVKVVTDATGRALYFSRSVIPCPRDGFDESMLVGNSPWRLHVGIYGFRTDFLLQLTTWPQSPLEKLEKLEQLRALEAGVHIQVADVDHPSVGIDTPEDYAQFVERMRNV